MVVVQAVYMNTDREKVFVISVTWPTGALEPLIGFTHRNQRVEVVSQSEFLRRYPNLI